ncbi:hypothetical protein RCL1_006549 [Eukaryota sp. TZLM3-RCL]
MSLPIINYAFSFIALLVSGFFVFNVYLNHRIISRITNAAWELYRPKPKVRSYNTMPFNTPVMMKPFTTKSFDINQVEDFLAKKIFLLCSIFTFTTAVVFLIRELHLFTGAYGRLSLFISVSLFVFALGVTMKSKGLKYIGEVLQTIAFFSFMTVLGLSTTSTFKFVIHNFYTFIILISLFSVLSIFYSCKYSLSIFQTFLPFSLCTSMSLFLLSTSNRGIYLSIFPALFHLIVVSVLLYISVYKKEMFLPITTLLSGLIQSIVIFLVYDYRIFGLLFSILNLFVFLVVTYIPYIINSKKEFGILLSSQIVSIIGTISYLLFTMSFNFSLNISWFTSIISIFYALVAFILMKKVAKFDSQYLNHSLLLHFLLAISISPAFLKLNYWIEFYSPLSIIVITLIYSFKLINYLPIKSSESILTAFDWICRCLWFFYIICILFMNQVNSRIFDFVMISVTILSFVPFLFFKFTNQISHVLSLIFVPIIWTFIFDAVNYNFFTQKFENYVYDSLISCILVITISLLFNYFQLKNSKYYILVVPDFILFLIMFVWITSTYTSIIYTENFNISMILIFIAIICYSFVVFMFKSMVLQADKTNNIYGLQFSHLSNIVVTFTAIWAYSWITAIFADFDTVFVFLNDFSSTIMFVGISVLYVVFGFKFDFKFSRIVGLVGMTLSFLKLISYDLADFSYGLRALFSLICGILFLGSAFLYHKHFTTTEESVVTEESLVTEKSLL